MKKLLHRKFATMVVFFFCVGFSLAAQILAVPDYSVQRTKNGFVYTFSVKTNEFVRCRVFDSFTGTVSSYQVANAGKLPVQYNDTVTAWTENLAGTRSKEITLSKNLATVGQQPFTVLSPVEGTWANKQVLAVSADAGTEIFYSFSGSNPLEFGFAYDGPVLIDASGEVTLEIAAVYADGSVVQQTVVYTVAESAHGGDPLPAISAVNPVVRCGVQKSCVIPNSAQYAVGCDSSFFTQGRVLQLQYPSCIDRLLPLVIKHNGAQYRYVLQTEDAPKTDSSQQLAVRSPVQIIDWNFVMFKDGQNIYYSVDGGSWIQYSEPFYVDRTDSHSIAWRTDSASDSLELPAKPVIRGIPAQGITNSAVELVCSDSRYTFRIEKNGELSAPLTSFYVDTFFGDSQHFSLNLPIYYGNIRQGDIVVSFEIDKQSPDPPVFQSSAEDTYSREDVAVSLSSPESIFAAVDEVHSFVPFYTDELDFTESLSPARSAEIMAYDSFLPVYGSKLIFSGDDTYAVSYTVYAYAQDKAGNKSAPVVFRTIVDKNNFYVDAESPSGGRFTAESPKNGSPFEPYASIVDAVRTANSREKTNIHIKGNFSQLPEIQLLSDCSFIGYNDTVLSFVEDGVFRVKDAFVDFQNCSFEKVFTTSASHIPAAKKMIFSADGASVSVSNCEFAMHGASGTSVIACTGGNVSLFETGISVQSGSYVTCFSADNTNVSATSVRCALADSCVGFSLTDSKCELQKCNFAFSGKKGRGMELYHCTYKAENSFETVSGKKSPLVVWKDTSSVESEKTLFSQTGSE